jgi:hypothetical protein
MKWGSTMAMVGCAAAGRPNHSWDTLPVFFHSSNRSEWSPEAVKQIARFPMQTNEKSHAMQLPGGGKQSEEIAGPAACRQVDAEKSGTHTFFYLNSVIDWQFNYQLHGSMETNPSWRLKYVNGTDILGPGSNWLYNLTNDDMRAAWVAECVTAAKAGCTGCFIDQANVREGIATWPPTSPTAVAYAAAHLAALTELDAELAPLGGYSIYNHLGVRSYNTTAMMVEDFTATEKCITTLQTLATRGLTVQAHAGNYPAGNQCVDGDTNALAAFLIGAGDYHYYHCAGQWSSSGEWPVVKDAWLDWLPEYDYKLGAPLGLALKQASLWSRSFASGTRVEFDSSTGNGTIYWAGGPVQSGPLVDPATVTKGCRWESM